MKKIATVFVRDWANDPKHVTREPNPDCAWVFAGEGRATRKYDGTCVMYADARWWARREVKPGGTIPPNWLLAHRDPETGKCMGWEPIEQSPFAKFLAEALNLPYGIADSAPGKWRLHVKPVEDATYELCGPKINRNPEGAETHLLVRHGYTAAVDQDEMDGLPLDFDGLAAWLHAHPQWEGLVWHHPDGRMAKLKRRDMPPS